MSAYLKTGLRCAGGVALVLLAGCAGTSSSQFVATAPQAGAVSKQPIQPAPEYSVQRQAVATSPAVQALIDEAQMAREAGNYESAAATLERALRMQPRNAMLWYRFAELRLQQDKPQLALDLALKSKLLAGGDRLLLQQNLALIAHAKGSLGDAAGAAAAEAERQAIAGLP